MADGIYVGMAAAAARAEQLESIADNLANVETPGFKASRPAFQSFLPAGAGATSDKVAAAAVDTGVDLGPGMVVTTEKPLDIIPGEDAFFMVRTPAGPAYTRNGRLTVTADGFLVSAGRPLIGQSGNAIQLPPGSRPVIDERGGVSIDRQELDRVALFQLRGGIPQHLGPSLYGPGVGGAAVPAVDVGVSVGQLEMSNSTALEATVGMIGAQRQFEIAMQAIQTYKRLDDRAIEVGKSR